MGYLGLKISWIDGSLLGKHSLSIVESRTSLPMARTFELIQFTTFSKHSQGQRGHHTYPIRAKSRNFRQKSKLSFRRSNANSIKAALITDPNCFEVGKFLGSYGYMNITSYSSFQQEIDLTKFQNVGEGQVKIRLYEGRVIQGPIIGTNVLFKVYPGKIMGGVESDMMAANELSAHLSLQNEPKNICKNIQFLLGAFETTTGEQWLVFRNNGKYNAADYAKFSTTSKGISLNFPIFGQGQNGKEKRRFVIKLLHGAINGLSHMHDHDLLHQSLGPSSIVLNTVIEREAQILVPKLRDLAFSVDLRNTEIENGTLSEGLWSRAVSAGALSYFQKRAFGISDDIYEAGLLFAYLAFIPFCENGVMDGVSLRRLLENTFSLDLSAVREYCVEDEQLLEAVKFLDLGDGSGWELLQAMLNPDYRVRPVAKAILDHRFITELF